MPCSSYDGSSELPLGTHEASPRLAACITPAVCVAQPPTRPSRAAEVRASRGAGRGWKIEGGAAHILDFADHVIDVFDKWYLVSGSEESGQRESGVSARNAAPSATAAPTGASAVGAPEVSSPASLPPFIPPSFPPSLSQLSVHC